MLAQFLLSNNVLMALFPNRYNPQKKQLLTIVRKIYSSIAGKYFCAKTG